MKKVLLSLFVLTATMFSQAPKENVRLKEYSYPSDGFSVKLPYSPTAHADSSHADFRVWTVHLEGGAAISIRLKQDAMPCDVALERLKSMAKAENVTIRESSVSGRPMWEEKERPRGSMMLLERYVCGVGRFYVLTFVWPANGPRPEIGMKSLDSFRLITGN